MKTRITASVLLLITSLFIIISCNKDNIAAARSLSGETVLAGSWEQRVMYGPLVDINPDAFVPGNRNIWSFTDTTFRQQTPDAVYKSGSYTTGNDGYDPFHNKTVSRFIFNGVPSESFELRDDTLFVYKNRDEFMSVTCYVKVAE